MELRALIEAKEAGVKAFDAQNAGNMKELEDIKRKLDEIQRNKDLLEGINDKLQADILTIEEKYSQSEAEVKCLKHILAAFVETKEAAAKAFDAEKVEIMKELDNLKRKIEDIQAIKDLTESENDELRSEILATKHKHSLFEAEVKSLKMELNELELAKDVVVKAFDAEKAETLTELDDLKRKVEEI